MPKEHVLKEQMMYHARNTAAIANKRGHVYVASMDMFYKKMDIVIHVYL